MKKILLIILVPITLLVIIFGLIDWLSEIPKLAKEDQSIVNYGYLGSFLSGTLGVIITTGSLIFLAQTLNFERKKSDQENFDNKFFLMLERLENIKDKIDETIKNKILDEINKVSEISVKETLEKSKKIIHKYNSEVGHYYRMLYQILKMIDQNEGKVSNFKGGGVAYYTNILRATLDFKLTQILAINTYFSKNFDPEYEKYAYYIRKYNFLEHMPFSILENRVSDSLLSVYLNCSSGFGNSSFLKKLNPYVLNSISRSLKIGYNYDLTYSYLKSLSGNWIYDKKIKCSIDLRSRKILISFEREKVSIDLLNLEPGSEKFCKCLLYNDHPYSIHSYFDENLNLVIEYEDCEHDFKCSNTDLNDMKEIKFILISSSSNELKIAVNLEYFYHDEKIYLEETMCRLKAN